MSTTAGDIFDAILDGETGGTLSRFGQSLPVDGFYVGGFVPSLVIDDPFSRPLLVRLEKFVADCPTDLVGFWFDTDNGKLYLDAVQWFKFEASATRVGRKRNEIAIWDVANAREIRLPY